MRGLIYGISLFVLGQAMIWFQTNGQFVWPWFKKNPLLVSLMGGTIVSYMFIHATRMVAEYNNGLVWPGRFIGFSAGIITFAILTHYFLNEGITVKTAVSLFLAVCLVSIQLFWK